MTYPIILTCFYLLLGISQLELGSCQTSKPVVPGGAEARAACGSLRKLTLPASSIGLPTHGASVTTTRFTRQGSTEYCKVLGQIRSVDPNAQPIRFEVNLPTQWNRKAVHFGGGSFDGWLAATNGLKRTPVSVADEPVPLARGYATFGSDSGHHKHYLLLPDVLNVVNASFARNEEERRNFAQDGLKKTHDAAVAIMQKYYGEAPRRMFFLGGSTGGREAYFVVQRWPDDYDGVLGAYAGWDQTELDLQFIRVSEAMYSRGGFLPKKKTKLIAQAVLNACDSLDGVRDGIISNVDACHYEPSQLLCKPSDPSNKCLTPQQLKTLQTFATEQRTEKPLWHDVQTMPGFNVLQGADLTGSMGLLQHAEHPPRILLNSFYYVVGDQVLRFFLTGNPHFDTLSFDTTTGGKYANELLPQSKASDASIADLALFAKHGGKLILLHGTADATIPTDSTVLYYRMIQAKMGPESMAGFMRFYLIPGYGHGHGIFDAGFDALGILDTWRETGIAPTSLKVVDNNKKNHHRTRPLCTYPTWPKYKGGDVDTAESFTCADN